MVLLSCSRSGYQFHLNGFYIICCIGLSGIMGTDKTNNKSLITPVEVGYMDHIIITFDQLNLCCVSNSCSVY